MKQWEDDDFYDSGEDEFHDRTGELEMKRKLRMQRAGKKSKGGKSVETYDSLVCIIFTTVVLYNGVFHVLVFYSTANIILHYLCHVY